MARTDVLAIAVFKSSLDAEKPAGLQAGGPLGDALRVHHWYLGFWLAGNGNGVAGPSEFAGTFLVAHGSSARADACDD